MMRALEDAEQEQDNSRQVITDKGQERDVPESQYRFMDTDKDGLG
jgi:hypothetical protein